MTTADRRALLLDWDGTLTDSIAAMARATREVLTSRGLPWSRREFCDFAGDWKAHYVAAGLPEEELADASRDYQRLYAAQHVRLRPHARATVTRLAAAGVGLALVTSGRRDRVVGELQRARLDGLFGAVVTGEDVRRPKPDPEAIETALHTLGVTPRAALAVGDTESDRQAAIAAGVRHLMLRSRFTGPASAREALPSWPQASAWLAADGWIPAV